MDHIPSVSGPTLRALLHPTRFGVALVAYAALVFVILVGTQAVYVSQISPVAIAVVVAAMVVAIPVRWLSPGLGWLMLIFAAAQMVQLNQTYGVSEHGGPFITSVLFLRPIPDVCDVSAIVVAALYATERRRRLGRWVVPVAAGLVLLMVASLIWFTGLPTQPGCGCGSPPCSCDFTYMMSTAGDPPLPLLVLLGLLGDLMPGIRRARARRTLEGQRRVPTNLVRALVDELVPGRAAAQTAVAAAERARFASDLHAEVLPHLARTIARSERGASADELTSQLRDLETDLRALMTERRLVILEEFGLVPALEWLAEQTQDRFDVEVALDVEALDEVRPPREVERAAFRIAQLALDNAVRHGAPSAIALSTRCATRQVALSIRDDGIGIAPEAGRTAASRNRAGLADMRVEADRVGGALDVHPARPGTEVTFAWAA